MNIPIVKNRNITVDHLGSKSLHLNPHGIARLAMNLKASKNYELDLVIQFLLGNNILLQRITFLLIVIIPRETMILLIWIF